MKSLLEVRHYKVAAPTSEESFSFRDSLRFAMDAELSVDSAIIWATIMRPRVSACYCENTASENIQAANSNRFSMVRLKTPRAFVSDCAQGQMGRS